MDYTVKCPYCKASTNLVSGLEVYPHREDLSSKKFYLCKPCNAYVGCHPDSSKPLGTPANKATRKARSEAHRTFDVIWKDGYMARSDAYRWLSARLGIAKSRTHIAMFSEGVCFQVVALAKELLEERKNLNSKS